MHSNKPTNKTRSLSLYDFFEILQAEYVVCELRALIYPIQSHKDFWNLAATKKREKIDDISRRNNIPSMFDDNRIKEVIKKKIYKEVGFPTFIYRDEAQREKQEKWDIFNYYSVGARVNFYDDIELKDGHISDVDLIKKIASINSDQNICKINLENITRIL